MAGEDTSTQTDIGDDQSGEGQASVTKEQYDAAVRAMHEGKQEAAELRGQLAILKEQAEQGTSDQSKANSNKLQELLQNETFMDELRDDPSKVKLLLDAQDSAIRSEFGDVLQSLYDDMEKRFKSADPERAALAEAIEELKSDPDMKGLSEDALLAIARRDAKAAGKPRPPGAPTGSSRTTVKKGGKTKAEEIEADPVLADALNRMVGHVTGKSSGGFSIHGKQESE